MTINFYLIIFARREDDYVLVGQSDSRCRVSLRSGGALVLKGLMTWSWLVGVSVAGHSGVAEWLPAGHGLRDVHGNPLPVLYRDDFSPSQRVSSRCRRGCHTCKLTHFICFYFFSNTHKIYCYRHMHTYIRHFCLYLSLFLLHTHTHLYTAGPNFSHFLSIYLSLFYTRVNSLISLFLWLYPQWRLRFVPIVFLQRPLSLCQKYVCVIDFLPQKKKEKTYQSVEPPPLFLWTSPFT